MTPQLQKKQGRGDDWLSVANVVVVVMDGEQIRPPFALSSL